MYIEGKNAVLEALDSKIKIEKLFLLENNFNKETREIIEKAKTLDIPFDYIRKEMLDKMSVTKKHQGVIIETEDYDYAQLDDILASPSPKMLLLLDGIEDPHNIGAITRVADCVGASGILIPKHRSADINETAIRVSAGATSHVKIAKVNNLNDAIRRLKEEGIFVFCADMDGESIYRTNLTGDIAVVIGSEGEGVHTLTKKLCDGAISLPQLGKVNSLNASVATGVIAYEIIRQRLQKTK